jgi:glucokinase
VKGPQAIGVDLGGTNIRVARIDQHGQILDHVEELTKAKAGAETVLNQIQSLVESIRASSGAIEIRGVGVSAPGPLDTKTGAALNIPTLAGFDNYPLLSALTKRLQAPVILENDGIAAAIGEWRFGAGMGLDNILYVTVSTGIGGGVILDNRVLRGRQGMAGHIGHMMMVPDGALCNCGNHGCFEAYGAGPAFAARAKLRASHSHNTILGKHNTIIDSPAVFAAAKLGDELALSLLQDEAGILGSGFASLAHLFSPDVIIMGGGLSHEFETLYPTMHERFQNNLMPAFKTTKIVKAQLGGNSGIVGAASLVFGRI